MKKYVHDNVANPISVEVIIEYYDPDATPVAASQYKGFEIPEGPLISGLPGVVADSQAVADYEAFIESVQDLITDYYGLEIYYHNSSKDFSHYFGMVARNEQGEIILKFDFTLRISNHQPHRSNQSQQHKKEKKEALNKLTNGRSLRPITKNIIVNKEECISYDEAYMKVDNLIERTVNIMKNLKRS